MNHHCMNPHTKPRTPSTNSTAAHTNTAFIKELFFQQMKKQTLSAIASFDLQHSDAWL